MRNSSDIIDVDMEYTVSDGCEDDHIDDQPISCTQQRCLMPESSSTSKRKYTSVTDEDADDDEDDDVNGGSSRTGAKKTRKSSSTEVDVQAIVNAPTREDKRCDIDYHFREPVLRLVNGKMKKCCSCKLCPNKKFIVNEGTTLRRHLEAYHSGKYRKWAKAAGFESKLPGDVKRRKAAVEIQTGTLDRDLKEKKIAERVERYTDKAFIKAAIEWLVVTDQPLNAFEHPKFKEMIDMAARSTNGVKIPTVLEVKAEI